MASAPGIVFFAFSLGLCAALSRSRPFSRALPSPTPFLAPYRACVATNFPLSVHATSLNCSQTRNGSLLALLYDSLIPANNIITQYSNHNSDKKLCFSSCPSHGAAEGSHTARPPPRPRSTLLWLRRNPVICEDRTPVYCLLGSATIDKVTLLSMVELNMLQQYLHIQTCGT